MRDSDRRVKKYSKKIDGSVLGKRYDEVKEMSIKSFGEKIKRQVELELKVKEIVSSEPSIKHHYYILFAKQFNRWTSDEERSILIDTWTTRGLDIEMLSNIAWEIFEWSPAKFWIWDINSFWDVNRWF